MGMQGAGWHGALGASRQPPFLDSKRSPAPACARDVDRPGPPSPAPCSRATCGAGASFRPRAATWARCCAGPRTVPGCSRAPAGAGPRDVYPTVLARRPSSQGGVQGPGHPRAGLAAPPTAHTHTWRCSAAPCPNARRLPCASGRKRVRAELAQAPSVPLALSSALRLMDP